MDSLKNKWKIFGQIVLDPAVVILFFLVLVILISLFIAKNPKVIKTLTVFISVATGFLASIATARWSSINEERLIIVRGKAAVRSLKLLLGNIFSVEGRVRECLKRFCDDPKRKIITNEVIKTYLEDILNRYEVLEEETQSSIENWTDILPEASIKTQIGEITRLKEELSQKGHELAVLIKEKEEAKGQSDEIDRLKEEINEKEDQISRLQIELQGKDLPFSSGSKRYGPNFGSFFSLDSEGRKVIYCCEKCGYKAETTGFGFSSLNCPKCGTMMDVSFRVY